MAGDGRGLATKGSHEGIGQHGTVLEALRALDVMVEDRELRDHLALFLFCGDDVDKPVSELSGGEKQRLSLARMVRAQFDLLCMDEPTNHLDVSGTEGLEQALKEFPGTIVIVTHDRKLASELCDRVLWVERGAVRTFDGGLEPCLQALAQERSVLRQQQSAQKEQRRPQEQPAASKPKEPGKIRNPILFEKLEARIMELEEALEQTRADMLSPDNYSSAQKMQDLQARETQLKQDLAAAYEQWENW